MMSANTPTLTNLSKIVPISFISKTGDTTIQSRKNTTMPKNVFIDPESFMILKK